jgi:ribosomal protein S18 acetylase RimI-like enzyme
MAPCGSRNDGLNHARRELSLRGGQDRACTQAAAPHQLQLFDLSSLRHAVGLLRPRPSDDHPAARCNFQLYVGRQTAAVRAMRDLRLHHQLGTGGPLQAPDGHQSAELRSRGRRFDTYTQAGWRQDLEVSRLTSSREVAKLTIRPLTLERWRDLEAVFNARGCSVARGCWCMFYRQSGAQTHSPDKTIAQTNRARLKRLVAAGGVPGLIAYRDRAPVGWVSMGPREDYARLARSPVMRPVDDKPVWSIICFVVPSEFRREGIAHALLKGAIAYARKHGARLIEAYPVDTRDRMPDDAMWFGAKSMYDEAGFTEVARRKPRRPIVRLTTPRKRAAQ